MKLLALLGIALGLVSARPVPVPRDEGPISYNAIALITCGEYMGTAFWISPHRIITANHVSGDRSCSIGGIPLIRVRNDYMQDVAEFSGLPSRAYIRVRCYAPRRAAVVHASGYAYGAFRHTSRLIVTDRRDDGRDEPIARGMVEMNGRSFPGMSGGPMMNRDGEVVALLSRGRPGPNPATWGRLLRESFICQRR